MPTKKQRIKRLIAKILTKIFIFAGIMGVVTYIANFSGITTEMAMMQFENDNFSYAALAKAEADADAKAMIMAAEAQAQANRLLSESLTPALLEKMYYEKWNGELPYIYGDSTPIIQVP